MNYKRLKLNLEKYERDSNFLYVSDSYKPYLRRDKKFIQFKRIYNRVTLKAMDKEDRAFLNALLGHKAIVMRATHCSLDMLEEDLKNGC